ncbi:hypothetical protein [Delftia deserti]|uniref:Uncharacterized protein n=1 Tax=Delftia deserti TaxID=1651218 RepID=A0ABW5EWJ5_9BURK
MKYLFFLFSICLNFSSSYAKDIESREPECLVGVDSKKFAASFQIMDKDQKIWIINDGGNEENEINYSWIVEPGSINNGNFLPVKYAFGVGHGNEYESKGQQENSLSSLLEEIKNSGMIYINSPDKKSRQKISRSLENIQIHMILNRDKIILYSRSIEGRNNIFSSKPTHARMTMKTPYKSQSYTCLTEIDYQ